MILNILRIQIRHTFGTQVASYHIFFAQTAFFDGRTSKDFEAIFNETWHIDLSRAECYQCFISTRHF